MFLPNFWAYVYKDFSELSRRALNRNQIDFLPLVIAVGIDSELRKFMQFLRQHNNMAPSKRWNFLIASK